MFMNEYQNEAERMDNQKSYYGNNYMETDETKNVGVGSKMESKEDETKK